MGWNCSDRRPRAPQAPCPAGPVPRRPRAPRAPCPAGPTAGLTAGGRNPTAGTRRPEPEGRNRGGRNRGATSDRGCRAERGRGLPPIGVPGDRDRRTVAVPAGAATCRAPPACPASRAVGTGSRSRAATCSSGGARIFPSHPFGAFARTPADTGAAPSRAAFRFAGVAELADAPDLGSGAARRGGSSPFTRTRRDRGYNTPCRSPRP